MSELLVGIIGIILLYGLGQLLYPDPVARALVSNQYITGEEE